VSTKTVANILDCNLLPAWIK